MQITISNSSRLRRSGLTHAMAGLAAAGATGATMMTANAAIVYSGPQNLSNDANLGLDPTTADEISIDIDGNGDIEFVLHSFSGKGPATHASLSGGMVDSGLTNPNHGGSYIKQLASGLTIGPADTYTSSYSPLTDEVING